MKKKKILKKEKMKKQNNLLRIEGKAKSREGRKRSY